MKILLILMWMIIIIAPGSRSEPNITKEVQEDENQEKECAAYSLKILTPLLNNVEETKSREEKLTKLQDELAAQAKEIIMLKEKEMQVEISTDLAKIENTLNQIVQSQRESKLNIGQITDLIDQVEHCKFNVSLKAEDIEVLRAREQKISIKLREALNMLQICDVQAEEMKELQSKLESAESTLKEKGEELSRLKENSANKSIVSIPLTEPFLGWTVIQRRVDGTVNFNRNWTDYRAGFGELEGNYFYGLERLALQTNANRHELYVHLENFDNVTTYARYDNFQVGSEQEGYPIKSLGEYSGNAGDALRANLNLKFTTFDRDNDNAPWANCAKIFQGGWWYDHCFCSFLNARYADIEMNPLEGIRWINRLDGDELFKSVKMMIRPVL